MVVRENNCTDNKSVVLGKVVGNLQKLGSSLYVLVPLKYVKAHNLKKGDSMTIYFDDILHVEPVTDEEILRKFNPKRRGVDEC